MRTLLSPARVGRWSARHPWQAIALWLVFVVIAVGALVLTGSKQLQNGSVGESARGDALLDQHQIWRTPHAYIYLHSDSLLADTSAFRTAIRDVDERMTALGTRATVQVSRNHHAALVGGQIDQPITTTQLQAAAAAAERAHSQVTAVVADVQASSGTDLKRAEVLSVPVTLLVLLLAFGAIVAALVPVLLAATAVIAAFGLLGPLSHLFPLDDSVKTVVLLIGMAVGVDYALFYVIRSREERAHGLSSHEALERTARTSGRTVVIAATTVAIAMAAQFVVGSDIFNGIAAGTIAGVGGAVAGSVTVLPAVLELLGPRIDRGRIPFLPRLRTDGSSRFWPAVVDRVLRRPVISFVLAAGLLVALAVPALGMQVAKPNSDALSASGQSALVAQVTHDFPGLSSPAVVVVAGANLERAAVRRAVKRLETLAAAQRIAHPPFTPDPGQRGSGFALELPLTGLGDNDASRHAVDVLRKQLIPATLGEVPGIETAVTGDTAQDVDFTTQMKDGIPYVIALVLILAFLLLLVTFRSIIVPLKAIVLNLLSVAASYGVLVLVFQRHWAESILGFHSNGAIISWLPLFLFVVLFGLSMDYHVFILSRVREAVDHGMSTEQAVRYGITRTAGVVTSAALVMVAVFSLFGTASALDLKQAGVGLAVAVFLDATVIRGVLLPASMKLLGDWNWYLPNWLGWLPKARVEGDVRPGSRPTVGVPAVRPEEA
jgi:RND superfamily putative drug exporter